MQFDGRKELPQLAVIAAMFAAAAIAWPLVPDRLPVHWNVAGEVDRFGGKFEGLLLLPLMSLGLYLLLLFIPLIDAKRTSAPEFQANYFWIRLGLTGFLAALDALLLATAFGRPVDMTRWLTVMMALLFVLLGWLMARLPPNGIAGIRTPWTLASPEVWTKTHRLGRWVFVAIGLSFLVLGWWQTGWAVAMVIAITVGGIVGLLVYSYLVRSSGGEESEAPPSEID